MKNRKLNDVTTLITKGSTPSTYGDEFQISGIKFVKVESIANSRFLNSSKFMFISEETDLKMKRSRLALNDLLVSKSGYLGRMAIVRDCDLPANTNEAVAIVRVDPRKVNVEYLYYYFSQENLQKYIAQQSAQSVQANLNLELLGNLHYRDIPLGQQKDVADLFTAIDTKIFNNSEKIDTLERIIKLVYDFWFLQFDFPNELAQPYKEMGGSLKETSNLQYAIPDSFKEAQLNSVCSIDSGFSFKPGEYVVNGKYKVVTIKNVQDGFLDTEKINFVDSIPAGLAKTSVLELGDILMSLTGNVGRMCLVDEENLLLNQRVGKIVCSNIYRNFLYCHFLREDIRQRLENLAGGSSQANLSPVQLTEDYFALPPEGLLHKFNKIVDPMFISILHCKKENQALRNVMNELLTVVMSGQAILI
jgi:type I restriction enzyme, S subunit